LHLSQHLPARTLLTLDWHDGARVTFPVSQSVLDADALANVLTNRYALSGKVRCKPLSRGMNDIYRVEHANGPHALKVARSGKSNDFDGRPESVNQAFVSGYDSVRSLSAEEKEAQPLFRLLRHLLITSTMAQYVNRIGPVPGFDKNIDYYLDMIRRYAEEAGIS